MIRFVLSAIAARTLLIVAALVAFVLAGVAVAQEADLDLTGAFETTDALYFGLVVPLTQVLKDVGALSGITGNKWGVRALSVVIGAVLAFVGMPLGLTPGDTFLAALAFGATAGLTGSGLKDIGKSLLGAVGKGDAKLSTSSDTRSDADLSRR